MNSEVKRVYADFHIHSKYSRATSRQMDLTSIAPFAQQKGLNLVGTGDFSHPEWLHELQGSLREIEDTGLYKLNDQPVHFLLTNEVNTLFTFQGKSKRIHHLLFTPNFDTAQQINERLSVYGDLTVDGRPTLKTSPPELVDEIMAICPANVVIPAHVWTPWYSLFGSKSGFDRIEDCYQDTTDHIFALETGLSSDPPMNWRLSSLDQYALISNSDCHSPYPYRIGREANVFDVEVISYTQIVKAIRDKNSKHFKFTIETDPAYGKYHWTGHRNCNVSMSPPESKKIGGICPVCGRSMTKGVSERIEDLADRPPGERPVGTIDYVHLLPLQETISATIGIQAPSSAAVNQIYAALVMAFRSEYKILLDVPLHELERIVAPKIASAIVKVRNNEVTVIPGYDGVYGKLMGDPQQE